MADIPEETERKATEALITAALHVWDHEVSPDEVNDLLDKEVLLSEAQEAALRRLGENPLVTKTDSKNVPEMQPSTTEQLLALHRKKPHQGFSSYTEKEIARRREELRGKIIEKRRESHDRS
jgi:hypothetical protein